MTKRRFQVLLILAIVVPVGVLATLNMTDFHDAVEIAETTSLDVVRWRSERMFWPASIGDLVERTYDNGEILIVNGLVVNGYFSDFGRDLLGIFVNITGVTSDGFVEKVCVSFCDGHENATVSLHGQEIDSFLQLENLTLANYYDWQIANPKALVKTTGFNHPSIVRFSLPCSWSLLREQSANETRLLEVTYEVVYFNGTTYNRVVQPFHVEMCPEDNEDFETADIVTAGEYGEDPLLWLEGGDEADFYKIQLEVDQRITATVTPNYALNCDLYLYDTNKLLRTSSKEPGLSPESVSCFVDVTGLWFVEIRWNGGSGYYKTLIQINSESDG